MSGEAPDRVGWYRQMVEIRLFEEKVQELFMDGPDPGHDPSLPGAGGRFGRRSRVRCGPDDYLTITYRGHGHALSRGVPMEACFAELMGRSTGCCQGVGGSMHFTDVESWTARGVRDRRRRSAGRSRRCVFRASSRGKTVWLSRSSATGRRNIGTFHEALNIAAAWKVGVVFIVENNLYGEYTPMRETTPLDDLADRAKAYAIPGVVVDGQDVDAVHAAVTEAVARGRAGDGPTLLEMKTYRYRGHSRTDPAKYRPEGELARWQDRDPIALLGAKLAEEGVLSPDDQACDSRPRSQRLVDERAEQAQQSEFPTIEEIRNYVYAA